MTLISKHLFDSAPQLARAAAADLDSRITELLASKEVVHLVVTGGTVGIMTLEKLAPLWKNKNLEGLHIWWCDERFVEDSSLDRNVNQAREALLSKINISSSNVHSMPFDEGQGLDIAGDVFARQIEAMAPQFDIVLLGMGADAHVASLFPDSIYKEHGEWIVTEANSPKPPSQRISLSYEAINSADEVWFLVAGPDKADAVASVFSNKDVPGGRVSGKLKTNWYLDKEAAVKITS